MEKKSLRNQILKIRSEMPEEERNEKSAQIVNALADMPLYQKADAVLFYSNYQSEVITTPLIIQALSQCRQVYLPKVTGTEMDFYRIHQLSDLKAGYKGIREPEGGALFEGIQANALMIMPGVVFDKKRHRIGYGKGFYDRYLARMEKKGIKIPVAALCFSCQVLEEIPYEAHDVMPDIILTENGQYI